MSTEVDLRQRKEPGDGGRRRRPTDPRGRLRTLEGELETMPIGAWTCATLETDTPLGATEIEAELGGLSARTPVTIVDRVPVVGESLIGEATGQLLRTPRFALGDRAASLGRD